MKKRLNPKWVIDFRVYLCKCGLCFWSHKHLIEHLKDTKRYRKYHYALDYKEIPFLLHLCHKNGKNINEAFMNECKDD